MRRLAIFLLAILAFGPALLAHGGNDHVRGVITQLSATSITVRTSPTATRTLTLSDKTVFEKSGKAAQPADLKTGDRVVVDVPMGTSEARLVRFGAPAAKATASSKSRT